MDEGTLRQLAEAIQADLPGLITDASERALVEADLTKALSEAPGTAQEALHTALRSHPATRKWMRDRDAIHDDIDRTIGPLGSVTSVGVLFLCPKQDYGVVQERVTGDVLFCPNDGSILQRHRG